VLAHPAANNTIAGYRRERRGWEEGGLTNQMQNGEGIVVNTAPRVTGGEERGRNGHKCPEQACKHSGSTHTAPVLYRGGRGGALSGLFRVGEGRGRLVVWNIHFWPTDPSLLPPPIRC